MARTDIHLNQMAELNGTSSVRTTRRVCKHAKRRVRCAGAAVWISAVGVATLPVLGLFSGCAAPVPTRTVTLAALEEAPAAQTSAAHWLVANINALRTLCAPLGPRLGFLQVQTPDEWERLANAAPQLRETPGFGRGVLIGVASWAGTPVDRAWPVHIQRVRVYHGAGLVEARFHPGTYLPDGTAYLETAHVNGLEKVLAVRVDGSLYYPTTIRVDAD